jgi:hypothetical protein
MEHVTTLEMYEDLINGGVDPKLARTQALTLNKFMSNAVTKDLLKIELTLLEKDLKIFIIQVVGGALTVAFILPMIGKIFGWI